MLQQSKCPHQPCGSLENYFTTSDVVFKDIQIKSLANTLNENTFKLHRKQIIAALLKEIDSYFPEGSLHVFNIFDPVNLPVTEDELESFGQTEIIELSEKFQLDLNALKTHWRAFITFIFQHSRKCDYMQTRPHIFWRFFLKEGSGKAFDEAIKLVKKVLVLPIGSAEAERGKLYQNELSKCFFKDSLS